MGSFPDVPAVRVGKTALYIFSYGNTAEGLSFYCFLLSQAIFIDLTDIRTARLPHEVCARVIIRPAALTSTDTKPLIGLVLFSHVGIV